MLKEPFGFQEFLFTGGTALGVTLCACATLLPHDEFVNMSGGGGLFSSGTTSTPVMSEEEVGLYSWRDPWYLAYLACCVVPGFGTLIYVNSEESAVLEERERMILSSSSSHHKNKRIELTTTTSNASRLSSLAKGAVEEGGVSPPSGLDGRESSSSSSSAGLAGGGSTHGSPKTKVLR